MRNNMVLNNMNRERLATTPMTVPRTLRRHHNPILQRAMPGKVIPIAAAGMHRHDAVQAGILNTIIQMDETADVLINPVNIKYESYLVPWLAFERFQGRDMFEKSYSGQPFQDGDDVIPFIETMPRGAEGDHPVLDALGRHERSTEDISTMYIEAYNLIVNYRNKMRSLDLTERTRLDSSIADAHRDQTGMRNVVPSFDEAAMEGAVEIELLNQGALDVKGLTREETGTRPDRTGYDSSGTLQTFNGVLLNNDGTSNNTYMEIDASGHPNVRVEFEDAQFSFSLANIDQARKLQAFAKLRERFSGHSDEEIINKLMNGIQLPDQMFEQPIFMGSRMATFGFNKRYSSSSDNLDASIVDGLTQIGMQFSTPQIGTGGVLMVIGEIQPEPLYERQPDPFLTVTDVSKYPEFMRDFMDEKKVDFVYNEEIDTSHTDRGGVFGYCGRNDKWNISIPAIGTGFFQDEPITVFEENRNRIWDVSTADPQLGEDWYLVQDMPTDVFEYTDEDYPPFEISGGLQLIFSTNTVFGKTPIESQGDYEAVQDHVEQAIDDLGRPD